MKILDVLKILTAEGIFEKSPTGRPLTELAIETIKATLNDKKNYDQEVIQCKNCGLVISSLLVPSGCVSCNSKDLTKDIIIE
jgi:predicted Zn-ribbon and HTH transcriptional regulator